MTCSVIIAGFILGIAGSLHCVGMCGPLSLALPLYHLSPAKKFFSLLLYQFGRIITYAAIGLIVGLLGRRINIAGYQQWFSIGMGILVLSFALLYFLQYRVVHFKLSTRFYGFIQRQLIRLLQSKQRLPGYLLFGMLNGLLPCGMIYIALATTLSFRKVIDSVSFMAMFGAGTLPAMLLAGYAVHWLKPGWRSATRKLVPVFITLVGIMLVLRGMNIGIPFISPELPQSQSNIIICHP